MEKRVLDYINQNKMIRHGDSVVLGVSGGADSVCLFLMLESLSTQLDLKLTVVHVNHHLRGQEADDDQKYVEELCDSFGITCRVFHIDMKQLAKEQRCSEEEAARNARYDIFSDVARECGAQHIAVAHNTNDSVETMLFNLCRGSGINGAAGIKPVRDNIIRPIMCLTRNEIEQYLNQKSYSFRTDSTNLTDDYSRNKIRNNVIPYLEENINSSAVHNIAKVGDELREVEEVLAETTKDIFEKCVIVSGSGDTIECVVTDEITKQYPLYIRRVLRHAMEMVAGRLKDITRQHVESVLALYDNNTGAMVNLPYSMVARKTYSGVSIKTEGKTGRENHEKIKKKTTNNNATIGNLISYDIRNQSNNNTEDQNPSREQVIFEKGCLYQDDRIEARFVHEWTNGEKPQDLLYTKRIDYDKIKSKLIVRNRKPGDFIVLDGRGDNGNTNHLITKKLKDYFINEKLAREERDSVLLVADGNEIVWIVGYRLSAAYKVTDETSKVLELSLCYE